MKGVVEFVRDLLTIEDRQEDVETHDADQMGFEFPDGQGDPSDAASSEMEFRGMSPDRIEEILLELSPVGRLRTVRPDTREVPRGEWWEFIHYVHEEPDRRTRWGLDQPLTDPEDGIVVCAADGDVATVRVVERQQRQSTTASTATIEDRTLKAGVTAGGHVGVEGTQSASDSERDTDEAGRTETRRIYECGTNDGDCRLNRRAFYKFGNFCFVTGSGNREHLRSEIDRVKAELKGEGEGVSDDGEESRSMT